jgi:hypothetical protein
VVELVEVYVALLTTVVLIKLIQLEGRVKRLETLLGVDPPQRGERR